MRIYTPFTPYEWNIIKQGLEKEVLKKIKFTLTPKSCLEGKSIILLNSEYLTFEDVFNILMGLFYKIKETVNNYK